MKRNIAKIQRVVYTLLQPTGPLSKELAPYDPIDKPVLCYEQLLYLVALGGTVIAKGIALFDASAFAWVRVAALILVILVILIALFNLLIPPRFSISRVVFLVTNIIWLLMLLSSKY